MLVDGVFYIPSDALLPGINKIVLKDNELFAILDESGESPRVYDRELGFYYRDTRYLDTWELILNDSAATPLSFESFEHSRSFMFMMTNKDVTSRDYADRIPRDRLKILRILSLEGDQAVEQIEITNYDHVAHTIAIDRRAGSRFHDIFEVRGMRRDRRGELQSPTLSADRRSVTLSYAGLDGRVYTTTLFTPESMTDLALENGTVLIRHEQKIPPRQSLTMKYVIAFGESPRPSLRGRALTSLGVDEHIRLVGREGQPAKDDSERLSLPVLTSDNPLFDRIVETAEGDIRTLLTNRPGGLYPDAGIPWFCAPFGRDGLITAYEMLPWCPEIAEGVLNVALSTLGQKRDKFTDEEPGKVFHEHRFGEMARLREIPFIPYFGSVDSTPLALILFGEYASWTKNAETVRRLFEPAESALAWVRRRLGDDGFLSYHAGAETGLRNQGWKDSHDSVMHASGLLAEPPIALIEVQAYAFRALRAMASVAEMLGRRRDAELWMAEANTLRARVIERFWDQDHGMLALALDGHGQACKVLASNMGHCLWSGILDPIRAARIAEHMIAPAMFTGHGIRTLAATEASYNPLSYHNGSVWPHDNAIIAEGLRNYGLVNPLRTLAQGLLHVAETSNDARLPELFCGFPRYGDGGPVPYDVACKPQAWSAGAVFLILKALLGLKISSREEDRTHPQLVFRAPLLPPSIRTLEIKSLRILDFELDVLLRGGVVTSTVEVLRTTGKPGSVVIIK